ncbi:uncharacterized protein LOC119107892 [Pollicipes pollicipes]|uniref:uncharacterized protein LOC119107892 n=1 Tax=Pollicipes pollicipes TaxID=41117 RepID=UPI001884B142|nr:uncharacterized protein LOC119107892 [Pollicipes pollicipes]
MGTCPAERESLALWRRRDSTNSAPVARVSLCLPDGGRLLRELRINYNISELRALLADEIQFDPDQLDIFCGPDLALERVPDSLVLAGLDVERRHVTLHVRLRSAADGGARPSAACLPQSAPVWHDSKTCDGQAVAARLAADRWEPRAELRKR